MVLLKSFDSTIDLFKLVNTNIADMCQSCNCREVNTDRHCCPSNSIAMKYNAKKTYKNVKINGKKLILCIHYVINMALMLKKELETGSRKLNGAYTTQ